MTTYLLSQIKNFKDCRVTYQGRLEVEAVVDAVIGCWPGLECVEMTAELGVAGDDLELILEIIEEHELDCTVEECEDALLKECEDRVGEVACG
jgi:hypothetical protein